MLPVYVTEWCLTVVHMVIYLNLLQFNNYEMVKILKL